MNNPNNPEDGSAFESVAAERARESAPSAQKKETESQHNDRVNRYIAFTSTAVAVIAALAAIWAGFEAHETRIEDERPYIRVEYVGMSTETLRTVTGDSEIKIQDFTQPTPHIKLNVFGKSPAVSVTVRTDDVDPDISGYHLSNDDSDKQDIGFLFPAEERILFSPRIPAGRDKQRYFGIVSYKDVHNHLYQTPFCFIADHSVYQISHPCTTEGNVE